MIEDSEQGVKTKASTKLIEKMVKYPDGRDRHSENS
jgi:hypothetical protein